MGLANGFLSQSFMGILKQAESGVPVSELCRQHGMSNASFYKWRAKFGGMGSVANFDERRVHGFG
jgi:transposase-like protein